MGGPRFRPTRSTLGVIYVVIHVLNIIEIVKKAHKTIENLEVFASELNAGLRNELDFIDVKINITTRFCERPFSFE